MNWIKKNSGVIFSTLGCISLVASIIESIKETREEKKKDDSFAGMVKSHPKTVIFALTGLGFIVGAQCTTQKQVAGANAAILMLGRSFDHYRERAADLAGDELDREVMISELREARDKAEGKPPWDEEQAFCLEGQDFLFKRTMLDIVRSEYHFNRYLATHDEATFNDLCDFFAIDRTEDGDDIGWDMLSGEVFKGYRWIDFEHEHKLLANGRLNLCVIRPVQKPQKLSTIVSGQF